MVRRPAAVLTRRRPGPVTLAFAAPLAALAYFLAAPALPALTPGDTTILVAGSIGVSRVTAWRYLERLADDNVVTRTSDYGRAGRPQVRYRWRR